MSNNQSFQKREYRLFIKDGWLFSLSFILLISNTGVFADSSNINAGSLDLNTSQGGSQRIGVSLAPECLTAIRHHVQTDCPDYYALSLVDNTNHGYYGKFVNDSNGFFHRSKPTVPNYYNLINTDKWVIAVDPEQKFLSGDNNVKSIIVVPKLPTFINPDETVGANHTRTEYHGRYVDSGCVTATIEYSPALLNDTIYYLESGCTKTNFVDRQIKQTPDHPFNFTNPFSTLHYQKYVKDTKQKSGGMSECIIHTCNFIDPYKKSGYATGGK